MRAAGYFALIVLVAIPIHYRVHYIILIMAALYGLFRGYLYCCLRWPLAMLFISSFLSGLLGRRRRW